MLTVTADDNVRVVEGDGKDTKYGGRLTIFEPFIIHLETGIKQSLGHFREKDMAQEVLERHLKDIHFSSSLKTDYNIQIINVI